MIVFIYHGARASASTLPFLSCFPSCLPICCEPRINLSQEECQSVRCQSEPRLPFHLPFLPMTEEGERGGGGGGREHSYITNTHTGYITLWKQCGSSGKSIHDVFPLYLLFFPWLFYDFCFYPSSSDQRRGCISKHESGVLRCLVLRVKAVFSSKLHPSLTFSPPDGVLVLLAYTCFLKDAAASSLDHRGTIFSHFYKCTFLFFSV